MKNIRKIAEIQLLAVIVKDDTAKNLTNETSSKK